MRTSRFSSCSPTGRLSLLVFALGTLVAIRVPAVTLQFAGRPWTVKQSNSPVGPGPNRFSNSPSDVWSDAQGLHLTIHKTGSFWYSSEVILNETHGYGTYVFQTTRRQDILNANATFGALYMGLSWWRYHSEQPKSRDRFRGWSLGKCHRSDQFAGGRAAIFCERQPSVHNASRFECRCCATRFFTWSQNTIEFFTLRGHYSPLNFPAEAIINHYLYTDNGTTHRVPTPGQENFRFNLWLFQSTAPVGNQPVEVVVNDFHFLPLVPGDYSNNGVVDAGDYVSWRKGGPLANEVDTPGTVNAADYTAWRARFGNPSASGSGVSANAAVPEPTTLVLLMLAAAGCCLRRGREA